VVAGAPPDTTPRPTPSISTSQENIDKILP
jgi:hypothetical protein